MADAETFRPLPQAAVNVPAIAFPFCDEIVYWKLPHVLAEGSVADTDEVQMPTSDGELDEGDVGAADAGALDPDVGEGDSTRDEFWNPQAPSAVAATKTKRREARCVIIVTNLSADARFSHVPADDRRSF